MTASRQRPPNPGQPWRRHPLDQPFAAERIGVPLAFTLSASEYQRLTYGEMAEQGDPWDITFCEPWLLAIQPSQRACWYAIRVEPRAEHYEVVAAFANGRLDAQGQEGSPVWMKRTALAMEFIILSVVDRHGPRLARVMDKLQVLNGLLNQERVQVQASSAETGNLQVDTRLLLGAIVGDYIGSAYETLGEKRADAAFFTPHSRYTDDTVMTCAVAEALYLGRDFAPTLRRWGRRHPHRGYGESFERWLVDDSAPAYGSAGNGAAMRVAAIGLFCGTLEEVLATARSSAQCSQSCGGHSGSAGRGAGRLAGATSGQQAGHSRRHR